MKLVLLGISLVWLMSCDSAKVITSVNYKPKVVAPEKVIAFCSRNGFEGTPILTFGGANMAKPIQLPFYPLYDKAGRYIAFDDTATVCRPKEYYHLQTLALLKNQIKPVYADSIFVRVRRSYKVASANSRHNNPLHPLKDSLVIENKLIGYATNLNYVSNYLAELSGNKVDVHSLYHDYLLFYEFSLFGKRKLTSSSMKYLKQDIEKLNGDFGNQIQLVLINKDFLTWMANEPE